MMPDEPNAEERLEEVDNDSGTTPFRPADDVPESDIDKTHQVGDTEVQPEEAYYDGTAAATNASEPNEGNAVTGYDPDKDERKNEARQ